MEGNRQPFSKKRPNPQFTTKGGNKKGRHNSGHEKSFGNSHASDTLYRILCHSRKIGSVIGKGGSIVKALREETQAKITVTDSVPGSDERVIIICSPSTKNHEKYHDEDQDPAAEKEEDSMKPHCLAQDALLKVHERIVEEDLGGRMEDEDEDENVVTARLLVPNNMVGCLLGKKGDVIQRLRSDTGANIRVNPAEPLPTCAMSTDELVQITGKPAVLKRALYEVSTLLHQNPRKDKPPLSFPVSYGDEGFHPPGPPTANMSPPGNPMWPQRYSNSRDLPPMPWMGGNEDRPSGFGSGSFNGGRLVRGGESPSEFSMKILCSAGKIGGVIGKGGFNVSQLEQETGASIRVEDASMEMEERVICVSSFEVLSDPRSQTIEAILQLQNKTSEFSEKGIISTRLLVPSSKVGCILGQGGNVINEMRRRTKADIRVFSKDDKPKCAAIDEELVQISGNIGIVKDALSEISSRLRARYLRDANAGAEPAPVGPVKGFGTAGTLLGGRPQFLGPIRAASSSGYELAKVSEREYELASYPVPPSATRYQNISSSMDVKRPNRTMGSAFEAGGSNMSEIAGTRLKLQDPKSGGSECFVEIHGSSGHLNATRNILQAFAASGGRNSKLPRGSYDPYENFNSPQNTYPKTDYSQNPYQNSHSRQTPYPNTNTQQTYQNIYAQQVPYQNVGSRGTYQYC